MIPIFSYASVLSLFALLGVSFPAAFGPLFDLIKTAGILSVGVKRRTQKLVVATVVGGAIILVVWFGLIAFAIQTKMWIMVCIATVSTALGTMAVAIVAHALKQAVHSGFPVVRANALHWSNRIPLATTPFSTLSWGWKFGRVLTMPLYGAYLLTVLPAKILLEIVAAIASFGPTFEKWLNLFVEITASASNVSWLLAGITMIQLQHGVSLLTLPMLGAFLVIIAVLVNLIFLGFAPQIKVKDFISYLSYGNILLQAFFVLGTLMPEMTLGFTQALTRWNKQFLVHLTASDFMLIIVMLVITKVLCETVVWARKSAPLIGMAVAFMYVVGMNITFVQKAIAVVSNGPVPSLECRLDCLLPDGKTVDPTKTVGVWNSADKPGIWVLPYQAVSPAPVVYNGTEYLVGYMPMMNMDPNTSFDTSRLWLVPWKEFPDTKTKGFDAFSRDWTDYGLPILIILALLAVAVVRVLMSDPKPKPAAAPAPAHGGGHGGH